ncbi:MAG: hypothetical protein J1E83_12875 [Lachnospiraceae bacterium]|nr:hypothetical protein [Lachnospiraceae bacterium]
MLFADGLWYDKSRVFYSFQRSLIKQTVKEQVEQAESLHRITDELQRKTDGLMAAISTFKV